MITPTEIRLAIERPSELPASASADDYLMERYQRVAVEAIAVFAKDYNLHVMKNWMPSPSLCPATPCYRDDFDCRACWREALREGKWL